MKSGNFTHFILRILCLSLLSWFYLVLKGKEKPSSEVISFYKIHAITNNIMPLPETRLPLSMLFSMPWPLHLETDNE